MYHDEGGLCHPADNDPPAQNQERDKEVVTLTGAVPVSGPHRLLVAKEGETFPKLNEDTNPGHPATIQPP